MARTSLTIDSEYLKKINELSSKLGMGNKEFVQSMVDYFDFYKINPKDREANLDSKLADIKNQVKGVRDTFVTFFRTMEKKELEPLIKQSNESTQALLVFLKDKALTKDDLKNISSFGGQKRVAYLENKGNQDNIEKNPNSNQIANDSIHQSLPESKDINQYLETANKYLQLYKEYFNDLIKSIFKSTTKGDYISTKSINEFIDKFRAIPKIHFAGEQTPDLYDTIEHVELILRTADNYCDEFIDKGKFVTGSEKLFYVHVISEYKSKFESIKI